MTVSIQVLLLIIAIVCLVIGLIGTVAPVIPGVPLAWIGILLSWWIPWVEIPLWIIVATGIAAVVVTIMDNIFPVFMTKISGGTKAGTWGCTIGLIAGFFIGPIGIILGPFAGAFIGEIIHDSSDMSRVLKAALGAFAGFLLGVGLKLASVLLYIWIFIYFAML